ncbi:MAG: hypothetical protein V3U71_13630 [Cocleimonas sp.]
MSIPQEEIDYVARSIREKPEYVDPNFIEAAYKNFDLDVIPDPFSKEIINKIKYALKHQIPYSVIRIGDGEANILTYSHYKETPVLNKWVFEKIIALQQDSFKLSEEWMLDLQQQMLQAIKEADIVGVTGLWRPEKVSVELIESMFLDQKYRGVSGHFRAIDHLLKLASENHLHGKVIASAHLYFSILEHLDELLNEATHLIVISDNQSIVEQLQSKNPKLEIKFIPVGCNNKASKDSPYFFEELRNRLPNTLTDHLCLIGAGPWSEIYCLWIKQRGGVAVDIGSGFDLLRGEKTRPIHKYITLPN